MLDFYKDKKVFVTGHTGFKGAWLCRILQLAGADVTGYALEPCSDGIYDVTDIGNCLNSTIADIRDIAKLKNLFNLSKPEIVFHFAAQPLVLDAYKNPLYTFDTNIMGTANLLECVRNLDSVRSVVIITTDKVYRNNEWVYSYRENDRLGDSEPYAASKACAELIASAYYQTYLKQKKIALSTARAGNVIGGGDVSDNRIIPDCLRAVHANETIFVRNPNYIRPYQHVLEPCFAYLLIAQRQYENHTFSGQYNIGPSENDCIETSKIVEMFCENYAGVKWAHKTLKDAPHEGNLLKLNCSKIRSVFNWTSIWSIEKAIEKTVEWDKAIDKAQITDIQIQEYYKEFADRVRQ